MQRSLSCWSPFPTNPWLNRYLEKKTLWAVKKKKKKNKKKEEEEVVWELGFEE